MDTSCWCAPPLPTGSRRRALAPRQRVLCPEWSAPRCTWWVLAGSRSCDLCPPCANARTAHCTHALQAGERSLELLPVDAPSRPHPLVRPQIELDSGVLVDSHTILDDFVELSRSQGVHLRGQLLLVLGVRPRRAGTWCGHGALPGD